MYNFMITGTNFLNKGAQSMLFTCTEELRSRFPGASIYYKAAVGLGNRKQYKQYHFIPIYVCPESYYINDLSFKKVIKIIIRILKSTALFLIGKGHRPFEVFELYNVSKRIDYYIDASGYCLTSKWGVEAHRDYYSNFELANNNGARVILMPQSFGPFDYTKKNEWLNNCNREVLSKAFLVFSREREGKNALENCYGIKNILISSDMVLVTDKLIPSLVCKNPAKISVPSVFPNSVGIVPNVRCISNGNEQAVLELYKSVIRHIIDAGRYVYVFRHSSEDLDICKKIVQMFRNEKQVILVEDDFDCFETSLYESQFSLIIGARYHSIVHAYKMGVPCILFGWAVKYRELADSLNQSRFVFDITKNNIETNRIIEALDYLLSNYEKEATSINQSVSKLKCENNCFDVLESIIKQQRKLPGE